MKSEDADKKCTRGGLVSVILMTLYGNASLRLVATTLRIHKLLKALLLSIPKQ